MKIQKRRLIHTVFAIALPVAVAAFGVSVGAALLLVTLLLLWRWAIVLSDILLPTKQPAVILDSITASHFVEKVRWCLDRLGVDYTERATGGVLGVVFTGRTVPRLRFRTGLVESSVGNSADILRYVWGAHAVTSGEQASFLQPTQERLELEKRLDRYGVDLQVWVYYHLLPERDLALQAWGANSELVPWWQRQLLRPLFPALAFFIRKSFRITDSHYARAVQRIEEVLGDIDMRLADGRQSILGGNEINYSDITFAALSGLWMQPNGYGGGKADTSRISRNRVAPAMRADIERWIEDYPKAAAFVARLYAEERGTLPAEEGQTTEQDLQATIGAEQ